jgi:hypothetical protein
MKIKVEDIIPKGMYCYEELVQSETNPLAFTCVNACPFRVRIPNRPEQGSGYCLHMQKGDWGENGTVLLWDQCKECGINYDDIDYELEKMDEYWKDNERTES